MPGDKTPKLRGPVAGVSALVVREGKVLLVKRAKPPAGVWSLPGGRVELGETLRQAALRELAEETGIEAEIIGLIDCIDIINRNRHGDLENHYVINLFRVHWIAGDAVAGDDASAVMWARPDELKDLDMTPGTADLIMRVLAR